MKLLASLYICTLQLIFSRTAILQVLRGRALLLLPVLAYGLHDVVDAQEHAGSLRGSWVRYEWGWRGNNTDLDSCFECLNLDSMARLLDDGIKREHSP